MYQVTKKLSLILVLACNLFLAACGGSGGSSRAGATVADNVTINGATYTENGTTMKIDGFLQQTSTNAYQYGGSFAYLRMTDSTSGNSLNFQVLSTASGWPDVYSLINGCNNGVDTSATMTDKSVVTGCFMTDFAKSEQRSAS